MMFIAETPDRRGPRTLRILAVASDGCRTLTLLGELDLSTTGDLETMIRQVFEPDMALLQIDLSRLTFMDCAGVHVLVGTAVLCADNGCEFQVIGGPAVQHVVELSGMDAEPWFQGDGEAVGG